MALSTQIRLHSLSVLQSSIVLCRFLWKDKEKNKTFIRVWIDQVMYQSVSRRLALVWANARPPGLTVCANALQLPQEGGGRWLQLELIDA